MSASAYTIETSSHTAGIAVADGNGFLFFAADPLFSALDGNHYPSVAAVQRATAQRERQRQDHTGRRQDSRGQVSVPGVCGTVRKGRRNRPAHPALSGEAWAKY